MFSSVTMSRFLLALLMFCLSFPSWSQATQVFKGWRLDRTYLYQHQIMKEVSWMYIGFAPRIQDAERIRLVISKKGYTLRITFRMTAKEVAAYPNYLIQRAQRLIDLDLEHNLQIYHRIAFESFLQRVLDHTEDEDLDPYYSAEKLKRGWEVLREEFPENIFALGEWKEKLEMSDWASQNPDDEILEATFVYPITTYRRGHSWPPDGSYVMKDAYSNYWDAIQERRTDHGKRVWVDTDGDGESDTKKRVITDYIFSGFPAFWIHPSSKGTGLHGPIRYSQRDQRGLHQSGPYGKTPEQMEKFWRENEFSKGQNRYSTMIDGARYRWDVIRTNNSEGCFRSEPMEIRHLLPSQPKEIHQKLAWNVITDIDRYTPPGESREYLVDVNYYTLHPYQFPPARREWMKTKWLTSEERKSPIADQLVDDLMEKSWQFPYLDPAALEFRVPGVDFSEDKADRIMRDMNRVGDDSHLSI